MRRLAGYQLFCWLALAFCTLSNLSGPAAFAAPAIGLALTAAAAVLQRAARADRDHVESPARVKMLAKEERKLTSRAGATGNSFNRRLTGRPPPA